MTYLWRVGRHSLPTLFDHLESPRGFRRLGTLGGLGSCLGTRRRGIRLSLDAPGLLGGSDGECSCDKQGWDCLRF